MFRDHFDNTGDPFGNRREAAILKGEGVGSETE
jgi:hypothetical protein